MGHGWSERRRLLKVLRFLSIIEGRGSYRLQEQRTCIAIGFLVEKTVRCVVESRRDLSTERLEDRTLFAADALGGNLLLQEGRFVDWRRWRLTWPCIRPVASPCFRRGTWRLVPGRSEDLKILARRLNADGQPAGEPILVDQVVRGLPSDPSVAVAENGNFTVVWSGRGAGDLQGIFARRLRGRRHTAGRCLSRQCGQ